MRADRTDVLKRFSYIEGHLGGVRKMIESEGIKDSREDAVIDELMQLYNLAGNR
ncbi:MAG: hypothetical protein ACLQUY_26715 [Ktedonobacterales bacterium]